MVASPTMAAAGTSKSGAAGTRHEMAGVVLLTLALLLGLSLLSYSPRDPILFEESFHPESVQNLIGQVGMTLATAVFAAVGGGGYLVPIALGILGSRCFLRGGLGVTLRSAGDRKSTRLNSSHANTSYAVFCLKKKRKPSRRS